jgi:predicted nucleic acid-binding Zn ribbon protein
MSGILVYDGPSHLDPTMAVVVILTGLDGSSSNAKTGGMVQAWILCRDSHPAEALASGFDKAICGECPHRPNENGRTCYVNPMGPGAVWRAYQRGNYDYHAPKDAAPMLAGRQLRLGAYGDPAAVPVAVWKALLKHVEGWTGYTHQWRKASALKPYVMASVDTPSELAQAHAKGWRTFRMRQVARSGEVESLDSSEIVCPAAIEAGKRTTCEECNLCRGASRQARSIAIIDHSTRALFARGIRTGKRKLPMLEARP